MPTDQPSSEPQETSLETPAPEAPSPESSPEESQASPEGQEAEESQAEEAPEGEEAAEEPGEGEEAAAAAKPEPTHKRVGGFQRKIDRLERDRQILMEQLASIRQGQPQAPSAPPAKKTPEQEAMDTFERMVDARLAEREAQRAQASRQAEFQRRMEATKAAKPDFDDVLASVSHIPVPQALQHAILTSEAGPEIMYSLASNPAELARISALPLLDAAREIGRLEAKSASGAAPQKPKSVARPPAPPSKVGGSTKPTRSLEDLPISEYKRAIRSRR